MTDITLRTTNRNEMIDITAEVETTLQSTGMTEGICLIYCPHTTAAITINEGADPDVVRDCLEILEKLVPVRADYHHAEGNSDAHMKSSLIGASSLVSVHDGRVQLGRWQRIFFCEFDGPRTRKVWISSIP